MPNDRRGNGSSTLFRIGLVVLATLPTLGLLYLISQRTSQAEAATVVLNDAAAVKTRDRLTVTVTLSNPDAKEVGGTLQVELIGPEGKVLGTDEQKIQQKDGKASYTFRLPATDLPADQVALRCTFGKQQFERALSAILLAKGHEMALVSSQEFHAGSTAAIRCDVHKVKSLTENLPLADATVEIRLVAKGDKVYPLYHGTTGVSGIADAQFKVPAVPPGQYKLEIASRSPLGQEKLTRDVQVKDGTKILLTTDKPLYQPGQLMYLRALALHPFDLTPVANSDLLFEVEDAKGNKVFKRTVRTSDHGIASIDFQLADEVNMGDYHVRAQIGEHQADKYQADKTVTVKKYVLPKFKVEVKADKRFYLPKETIHAELQSDYFFGKPVAGSKIKVTASTFDVQFRDFQTWEGQTDKNGHAKFDIKLPDYFVGQPLQKGNALVKLEVKLTDTADHTETITKTYAVSEQPIQVSLIPEGGRLVPGMENRVFAAAVYPDGSPAACEVQLWLGREFKDKPFASIKTNEAGLAEFRITPKTEQFRLGQGEQQTIELMGGRQVATWGQRRLLDLGARARDAKGSVVQTVAELNGDPRGDNVLLRLDKAIYHGGDTMAVDIRTSTGMPTVYLDVVKSGQTMLTRWLDAKDGKAAHKVELPTTVFGTLEVHAYQMLTSGEIIRDSRVVYVHPREDLKIEIKPDKGEYLPGENGKIVFRVTDAAGKPMVAALGVIVVDEAVYALQDMQPGLEKVYFTLQEELLKPQGQVVYHPAESIDSLVRQPVLPADKQQVAEVLLTAVKPKLPARWEVAPAQDRQQQAERLVHQIGVALLQYAGNSPEFIVYNPDAKRWEFKPGLLDDARLAGNLNYAMLTEPTFGRQLSLADLAHLEAGFSADNLGRAVTLSRTQQLYQHFLQYTNVNQAKFFKDGKWTFPDTVLADMAKAQNVDARLLKDAWGGSFRLVHSLVKLNHQLGATQFDFHQLVSAGPDRKFGTADDIKLMSGNQWALAQWWWAGSETRAALLQQNWNQGLMADRNMNQLEMVRGRLAAGGPPPGFGGRPMAPQAARFADEKAKKAEGRLLKEDAAPREAPDAKDSGRGSAPPVRVREYFPETMLWNPALITDDKGMAVLPLTFADSITTWRLSASASARGGALGGADTPLRVFQEFFVDIDLPVALTQNDEVAFPVAVYNYLKTDQTVKLELQRDNWFTLAEGDFTRSIDLKPGEVTAVKFRIRAKQIGSQPLTVKATGSTRSDAIKRFIEVVPDGKRFEQVVTDRLTGRAAQSITIPPDAIPGSTKLVVKVYPGIMSQVLEGTEGMLRLPGG